MKSLLGVVCVMTALKVSVPASAEVLDLSTIKCKDFFETLGKEPMACTHRCLGHRGRRAVLAWQYRKELRTIPRHDS